MERKDYLTQELSKEEKSYLRLLVVNVRKKYIRNNYKNLNSNNNIDLYNCMNLQGETVLEGVINKCENEIRSAIEFEKMMSNEKLYDLVKTLSLREKIVLFSLYKENKNINQIASEMGLDRTMIWRIKSKALDKIAKGLLGGK